MSNLRRLQENWEGYAQADPLWAICTDPARRGRKWKEKEFFETGKTEIETVLHHVTSLGLTLDRNMTALDFGCGVGRLTRALSLHFAGCCGVDISPTMIRLARELHSEYPRCSFYLNETDSLDQFHDGYFEFIYTSIVLQHIGTPHVERYLTEFVRVLRPGGVLIFQVPDCDKTPILRKVQRKIGLRRRIRQLIRRDFVENLRMEMHCVSESAIRTLLSSFNVNIIDVRLTNSTDVAFNGSLHYLDTEPQGYVSKQYCVTRAS